MISAMMQFFSILHWIKYLFFVHQSIIISTYSNHYQVEVISKNSKQYQCRVKEVLVTHLINHYTNIEKLF